MAKKNPARTQATRQKIMDCYWSLLEKTSESRVTATQVVQAAGINRSTFYEYFDSAEAVREAIEHDVLAYLEAQIAQLLSKSNGEEVVIQTALQILQEKGRYIAFLYGNGGSSTFTERAKNQIMLLLAGTLGTSDPIDAYRFEFVAAGVLAAYSLWFRNQQNIPLEILAPRLRAMADGALGS